ncbi:sensor histidine kinase [Nocardia huaxiensis]|uniref:ATP-binding protein n=1 Tax=Nocardia huaxiensis TaxID=2755382 RepID=A0A7D6ZVF0_9NOCA|nr:ATP-binding protein [Nocardia huaxiensis]QLY29669.1 ATP-binding protein [Nocardia huaxiensis]UFS96757.1 ATP-binding protein [Nocardia huaxiensis]
MTATGAVDTAPAQRSISAVAAFLPRMMRGGITVAEDPATAAYDRIMRRLGISIGIAGMIVGGVELPEIAQQGRLAPGWWTIAAMVFTFGWYPILAVVSAVAGSRAIRFVSGCGALSHLLVLASIPFVLEAHTVDSSTVWPYRVTALAVTAAVLAWPTRLTVAYLLVSASSAALATVYTVADITPTLVVENFLRSAGLAALFVWCGTAATGAAARVDRESAIASRRAAAQAAAQARDRERARFAALIHDAVLSTLLEASRAGTSSDVLRRQAERTLEQLEEVRGDVSDPDLLDARSAVLFLRSAVQEVNPGIRFATRTWPGYDDLRMPVHSASTIAAALTEAVRNSLRHASLPGREVRRTVTATVSAGSIRIVFTDDGAGFDLAAVSADRLGISMSILGRMRQLAGGSAFVESQPGEGTTVTLVWGGDGSR